MMFRSGYVVFKKVRFLVRGSPQIRRFRANIQIFTHMSRVFMHIYAYLMYIYAYLCIFQASLMDPTKGAGRPSA